MVLLDPSDFAGFLEHGPPTLDALEAATDAITAIAVRVKADKGITITIPFAIDLTMVLDIAPNGSVGRHMLAEPPHLHVELPETDT